MIGRFAIALLAGVLGACAEDGAPDGQDGASTDTDAMGSDLEPGADFVAGRFIFTDTSSETLEQPAAVSTVELQGPTTVLVCSPTSGEGTRALGVTIQWVLGAGLEPGEYEQDLEQLFVTAGFKKPSGGQTIGGGVGGTVILDSYGEASGDVVSGTATEIRNPDPEDPEDILESVQDIVFQCTVP